MQHLLKSRLSYCALISSLLGACHDTSSTLTQVTATTTTSQMDTAGAPVSLEATAERVNGRVNYGAENQSGPLVKHTGTGRTSARAHLPPKINAAGDVSLNYVDADIHEIIRVVLGDILKLNYSIDPGLVGTATLQTSRPLRHEELLPTLQSVLTQNGAELLYQNGIFRVASVGDTTIVPPVVTSSASGDGSQMVALRYASAKQLAAMLEPYVGDGAKVAADNSRNLLVITGSASARAGVIDFVKMLDVDYLAGQSYALFPVKSGTPEKVAADLEHALGIDNDGPLAGTLKIVPIQESNAIMVIAQQRVYLERASRLIREFDHVANSSNRNLHVYFLKNIRAGDLQPILQRAFNPPKAGGEANEESSAPGSVAPSLETAQLGSGSNSNGNNGNTGAQNGSSSGLTTSTSSTSISGAGTQTGAQSNGGLSSGKSGQGLSEDELTPPSVMAAPNVPQIIADKKSNCLLVVATEEEYSKIEAAIRRLDVLPLQVMVEATIAEVTLNNKLQYGTQFYLRTHSIESTLTNAVSSATAIDPTTFVSNGSLFPDTLAPNYPGFSIARTTGSPQFAIQALKAVTDVKVVSSPSLLVLDNEPATFQVGDDVPIITQSATSVVTSNAALVNSVDYRETGVILNVVPRINSGGLVTLDLEQEVSQVVNTTSSTINSPTIQERRLKSHVVVQDGETVALAGLISDNQTVSDSGIPYLKDIPVLGSLFSTKSDTGARTELIVLLTPHVIHDQRDFRILTEGLRQRLAATEFWTHLK